MSTGGLSSLFTGVSGLQAHQKKISVIGDNLANVNTTAFKAGRVLFQNLFSQTVNHGTAPTAANGGTNPRQIGLGVKIGQISHDFTQGVLETTGIPSDLAIEGDGFFILENDDGVEVFTRDGAFARNISNKLVSPQGNFVQGWTAEQVNGEFQLTAGGALQDVEIPIGTARIAKQTENVTINGLFNSDGNPLAANGTEMTGLNDFFVIGTTEKATALTPLAAIAMSSGSLNPLTSLQNGTGVGGGTVGAYAAGASMTIDNTLSFTSGTTYRLDIAKGDGTNQSLMFDGGAVTAGVINLLHASVISDNMAVAGTFDTAISTNSIYAVQTLPTTSSSGSTFTPLTLTAKKGGGELQRLEGVETKAMEFMMGNTGSTVQDFLEWLEESLGIFSSAGSAVATGASAAGGTTSTVVLDAETAGSFETGNGGLNATDRYLIKVVEGTGIGQSFAFSSTNYNTATNTITNAGSAWGTALDTTSRVVLSRMSSQNDQRINQDEPTPGTKLTEFTTTAASSNNTTIQLSVTEVQTAINANLLHVGDIMRFEGASGTSQGKIAIVTDINRATGVITFNVDGSTSGSGLTDATGSQLTPPAGSTVSFFKPTGVFLSNEGELSISGNQGIHNDITDVSLKSSTGVELLGFEPSQSASGESGTTTFTVFDATGNPKQINFTAVLEARGDNFTSLRWYAESPNDTDLGMAVPSQTSITGSTITEGNGRKIGSGRAIFDQNGQFVQNFPAGSETITLDSEGQGAGASLSFNIDFSEVNTHSAQLTDVNLSFQDGYQSGTLNSFAVNPDGTVTGIFSNGITQTVAQLALARFTNNQGLTDEGNNTFALAANSGPAQIGFAGTDGRGIVRGGALEGSNVDIANEFTDLIVTQRGFQANARVITTSDELLQEVVNLKR